MTEDVCTVEVWDEACRLAVRRGPWLLAGYRFSPVEPQPYLYPVLAPNAPIPGLEKSVTLDAPADHPHHRSVWWGHGDVDGVDFWLEGPHCGHIVHTGFDSVEAAADTARFVATSSWRRRDGTELMTDRRDVTVAFDDTDGLRIDLDVTLRPAGAELTLPQTVESGLPAVRVADMIDLFDGGHVLTSEGARDHAAGDTAARWVAAWGTIDASPPAKNPTCGLAMMDHPSNPGHPNRWFVRPFGWLTPAGTQFGPRTVPVTGLRLRHRLVSFAGDADPERLDRLWHEFAS